MVKVARIIGGAGTGKTTELLRLMQENIENGVPFDQIGFVSFTRAARREASTRAAKMFSCTPEHLEQNGWFRTLHSICFKQLECSKKMMIDREKDSDWLSERMGEPVSGSVSAGVFRGAVETSGGFALRLWDRARSEMLSIEEIFTQEQRTASDGPAGSLESTILCINEYEELKRLHHRLDFTDLLSRFAGVRRNLDEITEVQPEGLIPYVHVWFLDEQQDTSALLDKVCHRLVSESHHAYICGDPFQAIHGFAGARADHFMGWEIADDMEKTLPQSFRCPSEILNLGEEILSVCSDYFDRGIKPVRDGGTIEYTDFSSSDMGWVSWIEPNEDWLIVARTNFNASRMSSNLSAVGIPHARIGLNSKWQAPSRLRAVEAFAKLEDGLSIGWKEWQHAIKGIPVKGNLAPRTKSIWSDLDFKPAVQVIHLDGIVEHWGATDALAESIENGQWTSFVTDGDMYRAAIVEHGIELVRNPTIRVGTIHAVKGAEAENVAVLTSSNKTIEHACVNDSRYMDEERRLAYVAVTRSKDRLVIMDDPKSWKYRIPLH